MECRRAAGWMSFSILSVLWTVPVIAQGDRGKTELKAGSGSITIDYGRPSLRGRDMLGQLKAGDVWRLGMNAATTLTTPVDLSFGSTKIAKGSYSLFLKRSAADQFELIFNSKTGIWGTDYDGSNDVAKVPLKKDTLPSSVETFTLELKNAPDGGA